METSSFERQSSKDCERLLVLGLGNELIADDAVGIRASEILAGRLAGRATVLGTSVHGVALLDVLLGFDALIVVDAIQTGEHPCGTVLEIDATGLRPVASPSPHYTGLPELLELAKSLDLPFPGRVRIFAVEVADLVTLGAPMTESVANALPSLCARVERAAQEIGFSA